MKLGVGHRKCASRAILSTMRFLLSRDVFVLSSRHAGLDRAMTTPAITDIRCKRIARDDITQCRIVCLGGLGGEENSWRDVRGEREQQHGAGILQPVPPFRLP